MSKLFKFSDVKQKNVKYIPSVFFNELTNSQLKREFCRLKRLSLVTGASPTLILNEENIINRGNSALRQLKKRGIPKSKARKSCGKIKKVRIPIIP